MSLLQSAALSQTKIRICDRLLNPVQQGKGLQGLRLLTISQHFDNFRSVSLHLTDIWLSHPLSRPRRPQEISSEPGLCAVPVGSPWQPHHPASPANSQQLSRCAICSVFPPGVVAGKCRKAVDFPLCLVFSSGMKSLGDVRRAVRVQWINYRRVVT